MREKLHKYQQPSCFTVNADVTNEVRMSLDNIRVLGVHRAEKWINYRMVKARLSCFVSRTC
jgi:hypothetical protein